MAGILQEYLDKHLTLVQMQKELAGLIADYNRLTGRYLFVYSADLTKARHGNDDVALNQEDFYIIQDILRDVTASSIDVYLETPGGSGETAEEIARFFHRKFNEVSFVIAGEAKSAGTILTMSGDRIMMTDSGSLGPIDAQIRIGRQIVSAYDYRAWVENKRQEAEKNGKLNPFDAAMVAQISPGEIYGVYNSLEFAVELVKKWLVNYKFKDWVVTSSGRTVTPVMKSKRAREVALFLCNHMNWKSHGRSLKLEDLKEYLIIERIDDKPDLAQIVYRINTILRLIYSSSTIYKVFRTVDTFICRNVIASGAVNFAPEKFIPPQKNDKTIKINLECPKCHKKHQIFGRVGPIDGVNTKNVKINPNIRDGDMFVCDQCGFSMDLNPIKNQIELTRHEKICF